MLLLLLWLLLVALTFPLLTLSWPLAYLPGCVLGLGYVGISVTSCWRPTHKEFSHVNRRAASSHSNGGSDNAKGNYWKGQWPVRAVNLLLLKRRLQAKHVPRNLLRPSDGGMRHRARHCAAAVAVVGCVVTTVVGAAV